MKPIFCLLLAFNGRLTNYGERCRDINRIHDIEIKTFFALERTACDEDDFKIHSRVWNRQGDRIRAHGRPDRRGQYVGRDRSGYQAFGHNR